MTDLITKTEFERMFAQAAARLRSQHQRLTELDSIGGDGDHGTTMLRAAEKMEYHAGSEGLTDFLKAIGWRVLEVDGGASSSILGAFFSGLGDVKLSGDAMDLKQLGESFQAGLQAVSRQSKARPGDKTMMDALVPAVEAISTAVSVPEAFDNAAAAAQTGANATRDMVARYGRARSLGERTRGYPDPGATSIALIFAGFKEGLHG
jgi:phosphoenolpyruvate---glycerone phosphotransferase subunit DhaL